MWRTSSSCNKHRQSHGETKQLYCDVLPLIAVTSRTPHRTVRFLRPRRGFSSGRGVRPRPLSGNRLQVGLEVAVVADLLVDLQPVTLTVRDDHAVGGRIEFHRRREAEPILRLEALYPAPSLRHVGVGIDGLLAPLRQYLGITDQIADRPSLGIEDANPMIAPIGDVDIAIGVHGNVGRVIERSRLRITGGLRSWRDIRSEHGHRIRALGLFDFSILAKLHQELALGGQLLNAVVLPVGDIDVAILVERDAPRLVELTITIAGAAALAHKLPVGSEDLEAVVPAVDDDNVAVLPDSQTGRTHELAVAAAGRAPLPQKFAAAVEHRDCVRPVIRHVDMVIIVDGNPEGPSALPVALAVFEKIGDVFFFTGTAKLHFVDVHPEIILVAPVGGIENAVLT